MSIALAIVIGLLLSVLFCVAVGSLIKWIDRLEKKHPWLRWPHN